MALLCRFMLAVALFGLGPLLSRGQGTVYLPQGIEATADLVEFLSGDLLRGRLLGTSTNGFRWQHNPNEAPLTLKPQGLYKVRLAQTRARPLTTNDAVVRLLNGDELRGELREMDDRTLVLRTWYAGDLRLHRQGLASLFTGLSRYQVLYEGPDSMEGWSHQPGVRTDTQLIVQNGVVQVVHAAPPSSALANGWHYFNGAFYGINSGFLGRNLNLPPVSNIEFDLSWQNNFYLAVWFYTDRTNSPDGNAYFLQLAPRSIQLCRATRTGHNMTLGSVEMPENAKKLRLAIRTDVPNKTIALFINDVLARQWLDISNLEDLGKGLGFHLAGLPQRVRLANLRVTTWDGRVERLPEMPLDPGRDVVRLLNQDRVTGRVKAIQNGHLLIEADFGELNLPLERVAGVDFASSAVTNAPPSSSDPFLVRASLHLGGRLTMRLEEWSSQQVVASGPYFDRATFAPALFQSLQFNLSQSRRDFDSYDAPTKFRVSPEILLDEY